MSTFNPLPTFIYSSSQIPNVFRPYSHFQTQFTDFLSIFKFKAISRKALNLQLAQQSCVICSTIVLGKISITAHRLNPSLSISFMPKFMAALWH